MSKKQLSEIKLGILGGGQLGKMLINAANNLSIPVSVLDVAEDFPAASVCKYFVKGDFKNFDDVLAFGQQVDVLTIEIENVNTEALKVLKQQGKEIYPEPEIIEIIKDKGLQKAFYLNNQLPTPPFANYENKAAVIESIKKGSQKLPFVYKLRKEGYDGNGVAVIRSEDDFNKLFDAPAIAEEMVSIKKELSVIVAQNSKKEVVAYEPVEMEFNPEANLVEFLLSPAQISKAKAEEAKKLAIDVIKAFGLTGILAVEMFMDENDRLFINEVAPRPHNSGHQTIENAYTSQYEQHLRAILGLPLGDARNIIPAVMINLLGEEGYEGKTIYKGLEDVLGISGVNVHLYGKKHTRPFRKMGHVTIIDNDLNAAKNKAKIVRNTLKIIA